MVGVPCGDAALRIIGDEITFDEVMSADKNALVLGFSGNHGFGAPRFTAAVNPFAGRVSYDVVANRPMIPGAGAERAQLRPTRPGGAALENESLHLDVA